MHLKNNKKLDFIIAITVVRCIYASFQVQKRNEKKCYNQIYRLFNYGTANNVFKIKIRKKNIKHSK